MVIAGLHFIDVFANDNERAGSYSGGTSPAWDGTFGFASGMVNPKSPARQPQDPNPSIWIAART